MISVICTTRNRTDMMERMVSSARQTSSCPLEFVFYIDDDDKLSMIKAEQLDCKYITRPRYSISLSQTIDLCYQLTQYNIIFMAGDDLVFRTDGWDEIVLKAFDQYEDKILLCGAYDGLNPDLLCHMFLHKNWINCLGRVVPPYFRDCYVDTWMCEVAQMIGRLERLPILIEHLHFSVGKSQYDQTAKERLEQIRQSDQSAVQFMQRKVERIQEAQKLANYIRNYNELSRSYSDVRTLSAISE